MPDNFNADVTMFLKVIFIMFRNYSKIYNKKVFKKLHKNENKLQ